MKPLVLLLLGSLGLLAQDASVVPIPSDVKTVGPVRFQICVSQGPNVVPAVIKIDTLTGQSWVLQITGNDLNSKGIPYVWTYVPNNGPANAK